MQSEYAVKGFIETVFPLQSDDSVELKGLSSGLLHYFSDHSVFTPISDSKYLLLRKIRIHTTCVAQLLGYEFTKSHLPITPATRIGPSYTWPESPSYQLGFPLFSPGGPPSQVAVKVDSCLETQASTLLHSSSQLHSFIITVSRYSEKIGNS